MCYVLAKIRYLIKLVMKKFSILTLIALSMFLVGCNVNNDLTGEAGEYTISGTYFTPEMAPDYVMITPDNPTIGDITVINHISPTLPEAEELLKLFDLPLSSERDEGCEYYRNGEVTLTIKNLKEVAPSSPSDPTAFQAEIVNIANLGEAECYGYGENDNDESDISETQTVRGTYFSTSFSGTDILFKAEGLDYFSPTNSHDELLEFYGLTKEFVKDCTDFEGVATVTFRNYIDSCADGDCPLGDMPTRFAEIVEVTDVEEPTCIEY